MVDYTYPTGGGGTLLIRDTGSTVEFHIGQSNTATFVNPLRWHGTVNGVAVSGAVNWTSGGGWRHVATYAVSAAQTVSFGILATGTSGFGGPTSFSAAISRATVPPAPDPLFPGVGANPDQVTATTLRYRFQSRGEGGSSIIRWEYQWALNAAFTIGVSAWLPSSGTSIVIALPPGSDIFLRARGVNAFGPGPASVVVSARTLTSARVGRAGSYPPAAAVNVGRGGSYPAAAAVLIGKGGVYGPAA